MDLHLDHLSIGYKQGNAVAENINVTFRSGELACIIGQNGVGKSTLLKTICGFLKPLSGKVLFDSRSRMSQHDLSRTVSIVLTKAPEVQNLTVEEMVALGRTPYTGFFGHLKEKDNEVVMKAMTDVGIENLSERMVQSLSDGERQKTMIARAIAQQTPIILLDEPTAFLDYKSKAELFLLLHRLAHTEHKTIIVSTHDLGIAVRIADSFFNISAEGLRQSTAEEIQKDIDAAYK